MGDITGERLANLIARLGVTSISISGELSSWDDVFNVVQTKGIARSKFDADLLSIMKDESVYLLNKQHADILRTLTGDATVEERNTWQAKAIAAIAYSNGQASEAQADMLETEANMVGETANELVVKVIDKNKAFHKMVGLAAGHRRAISKLIASAKDLTELDQVLDQAKATAAQLTQQFIESQS